MEENGRSVTRTGCFNHPEKSLRKPLRMRLCRPQNHSGRLGEERSPLLLPECRFGRAGRSGVRILTGVRDYSLLQNLQIGSASLVNGYQGPCVGKKRPEREVNHSPPFSAQVKNEWSCTSTLAICLHGLGREGVITFYRLPAGNQNAIPRWSTPGIAILYS